MQQRFDGVALNVCKKQFLLAKKPVKKLLGGMAIGMAAGLFACCAWGIEQPMLSVMCVNTGICALGFSFAPSIYYRASRFKNKLAMQYYNNQKQKAQKQFASPER